MSTGPQKDEAIHFHKTDEKKKNKRSANFTTLKFPRHENSVYPLEPEARVQIASI